MEESLDLSWGQIFANKNPNKSDAFWKHIAVTKEVQKRPFVDKWQRLVCVSRVCVCVCVCVLQLVAWGNISQAEGRMGWIKYNNILEANNPASDSKVLNTQWAA